VNPDETEIGNFTFAAHRARRTPLLLRLTEPDAKSVSLRDQILVLYYPERHEIWKEVDGIDLRIYSPTRNTIRNWRPAN